jgi:hypothetical protein
MEGESMIEGLNNDSVCKLLTTLYSGTLTVCKPEREPATAGSLTVLWSRKACKQSEAITPTIS